MKNTINFLKRIKRNNNTEWMHAHKDEYLTAKKEVEFLAQEIALRITQWDDRMPLHEPKDCMFRFNRDIRFSNNKNPYKENFGVYFSYGHKKSDLPGYYLNISPKDIFVAGGMWMPEPENLLRVRRFLMEEGDGLKSILAEKKFKKVFPELSRDQALKRPPKGFPADHEHVDLLKQKSFVVSAPLDLEDVFKPGFAKKVDAHFKMMKPLNRYLLRALDKH